MGRLTTHILDTAHGRPAAGVRIDLSVATAAGWQQLASVTSNADGRTDRPLLDGAAFVAGRYELLFHVADYFRSRGVASGEPPFLDQIPLRFAIADAALHFHVPLLVSPWSYSTYRGS